MESLFVKLVDQGVPAGRAFIRLLNMSASAAVLIVAVVLLRLIFRKAPKWTRAILWAIVALRLVCPVMISSPVSVYGLVADTPEAVEYFREDGGSEKPLVSFDTFAYSAVPTYSEPAENAGPEPVEAPPQQVLERKTHSVYLPTAVTVWLIGVCAMLLYMLVSFLILRLKVRASVDAGNGVRVSDGAASPFILGVFRPRIYMPSGMSEAQAAAALAHEREHIRRGDHVWKLLAFLLLAVHWFNPLVWLAYVLFGRDVELICDERVVRSMDADGRADYSQALLDCSARRAPVAACPLAFGESGVKARIKSVLSYKKPALWIVIAVIVVCAAVAVCFLTSPSGKGQKLHPDLAAHPEGYVVYSRDEIRPSDETADHLSGDIGRVPGSLQELAQKSHVAVKARLTAQDMLDRDTTEYTFTLLEDYFGTAEETMNLYTLGSEFFEVGGVYYLFLNSFDMPGWPHLNYSLSSAAFAVREYMLDGDTVLVYRTELNYGMDESTDMSAELKKLAASLTEDGTMPAPIKRSVEDQLEVAAVVEVVTVTETMYDGFGANRPNKYVVMADFTVDELLKGNAPVVPEEVPARVPYGTQVGDRFVVVFGKGITSTKFTSSYRVYALASEEAQTIIKYYGVEVSQPTPTPSPDEPAPLLTVTGANGSFAAGETPSWERTWMDDGWLYADGWPWYFDVAEKPEKAPTVYMTDKIELTLGGGISMSNLVVYSEDFTPLREDWYGDTALNWLEPGTYYCSVQVAGPRGKYVPSEDAYEESVIQCFFRLVVTEQGPAPARPSEIHDVTLARMTFWDHENVISDPAVLARLESLLGGAEDLGYGAGCPFGSVLTLTRADGREFSLCPAEDSCGVFFAGGNYFKYPGGNEEFWALVQDSQQQAAEQAARELAKRYMDGLCEESEERSFRVTEYRNLSVSVAPTLSMDEDTRSLYFLSDDEIGENKWIVEISVEYKYDGVKSPMGPSNGEWVDVLYQGSPVGFLMVKEGNDYSLRPRMEQGDRASMDASQIFRELPSNVENAVTGTVMWPRNAQTYGTSYDLKLSENEIRTLLNIGDSSPECVLNVSDRYLRFYLDNMYYDALTSAFPYSPFVLDSPGEQRSEHSKADYPPRDLAFMPISEAAAQVYSTLAYMGITGLELEQACALDAETLTRDLQVYADQGVEYGNYNSVNDDGLKQLLDVSFDEDNECYFFSFRLRIGEDAVLTAPASDQELDFSGATAYCLYGPAGGTAEQPGLIGLIIRNMPTGVSERGEQPVITPDKAAEAVVPLLNEGLKDARFVAAEFRYCYLKRDGRPVSVLRPTWVFTLAYPVDYPFAGSQITMIRYYAVDAITGEVLT